MKPALHAMALLLTAGIGCGLAGEPTTSQDPNFPLIQLPAQFQAKRQVGDFNPGPQLGQSWELFNATGPGCIRHFWLVPYPNTANPVLRIYVDNPDTPCVEMRLQEFFGVLLGQQPYRLTCAAFNHLPQQQGPVQGAGYNCYLPIPFRESCRITIEAVDAAGVIVGGSMADWHQYAPGTDLTPYRLHAVHNQATPAQANGSFPMADISGRGFVAGIIQGIRQRDPSDTIYHTGGQRWLIDGQSDPHAIRGSSLEDDFGFAWGFQQVMTRWIGVPYLRTTGPYDTDGVIYRFFGPDPVRFDSSLVLQSGSRADDTESVVYYYLAEDSGPPPAVFSPRGWQVTGPFPCPDYATFQQAEFPELMAGPWPYPIQHGGTNWNVPTVDTSHGWLDLSTLYQTNGAPETLTRNSIYARVSFNSDRVQTVNLQFGFDDWLTVWLNGVQLASLRQDSQLQIASVPAPLLAGTNELLIKLSNFENSNGGLWAISAATADDPTLVQVDPPFDTAPPAITTLNPADDATNVAVNANLIVTFNENVAAGTGSIRIKRSTDDSVAQTIGVTSSNVTFNGATMTIKPPADLGNNAGYYVQIPAGAIQDGAGNLFAGITNKTAWNFTVAPQATIVFTQQGFLNVTNLSTNGALVAAVNLGTTANATLNGITFIGNNTGSVTAGSVSISFFGADYVNSQNSGNYSGTTVTGVNADTLLDNVGYAWHPGGANGVVTISGLTVGQTYQLQLLIVDDLSQNASRTVDIYSGSSTNGAPAIADADYTSRADHSALLVTGTFSAIAGVQSFYIRGLKPVADHAGWLNAMQLRAIAPPDTTPPVVQTLNPADSATGVAVNARLVVTFNEPVQAVGGNILIRRSSDDSVAQAVGVTSGSVTFGAATMTINPPADLANSTGYYVQIPAGAVADGAGNAFAGISDKTIWNFTTVAAQATIIFTQQGFLNATNLSTSGTLVAAVNLGTTVSATVNGITFVGNNTGSVTNGAVTISFFGADYVNSQNPGNYNGTTVTGPDVETLLDNAGYAYRPGGADGSLNFGGLTVGRRYELQLLIVDDLSQNASRTVDIYSGSSTNGTPAIADADYTSRADHSALLVTGTFSAIAGVQSFYIRGLKPVADHAGWLNAMQLRTVEALRLQVTCSGSNLVCTWNSRSNRVYDLLSSTDLTAAPTGWTVWNGNQNMPATPPQNTLSLAKPGDTARYFKIVEKP